MKSIKEKAKEFGILNPNIHYDADGNTYNDIDKPSTDFEEGANYVLDAIQTYVITEHYHLKYIIKQLKK